MKRPHTSPHRNELPPQPPHAQKKRNEDEKKKGGEGKGGNCLSFLFNSDREFGGRKYNFTKVRENFWALKAGSIEKEKVVRVRKGKGRLTILYIEEGRIVHIEKS